MKKQKSLKTAKNSLKTNSAKVNDRIKALFKTSNYTTRFQVVHLSGVTQKEFEVFSKDFNVWPVFDSVRGMIMLTKDEKILSSLEIQNL